MSPHATYSTKGYTCAEEDSGVDLNRNYGVDFGVAEETQVGLVSQETQSLAEVFGDKSLTKKMFEDDCGDPCSECYRGPSAFSEPETKALRDFISVHQKQIKFVSNFHSLGNMWVYPFNGRTKNDIEERSPGALAIFEEIGQDAQWPDGNRNDGNSHDLIGDKIGGDMDDYILATFGIPSITNELGNETQYIGEWTVKSKDEAFKICDDNSHWLEHTYKKMGNQVALTPVYYKHEGDQMRLYVNVTNEGLSDMQGAYDIKLNDKSYSLVQGGAGASTSSF